MQSSTQHVGGIMVRSHVHSQRLPGNNLSRRDDQPPKQQNRTEGGTSFSPEFKFKADPYNENPSTDFPKDVYFLGHKSLCTHTNTRRTQRWSLCSAECQEPLHYCWTVWWKTSGWLQKAGALGAKDTVSVVSARWALTGAWTDRGPSTTDKITETQNNWVKAQYRHITVHVLETLRNKSVLNQSSKGKSFETKRENLVLGSNHRLLLTDMKYVFACWRGKCAPTKSCQQRQRLGQR